MEVYGLGSIPKNHFGTNFLVTIHHQENQSWQGVIEWLDTGKKMHFRSELEMLNLISTAVAAQSTVESPMRNWTDSKVINVV